MNLIDDNKLYLVEGEGDGTRDSMLAFGRDVEKVLTELMFCGNAEESKDEMQPYLDVLRDTDSWCHYDSVPEVWSLRLEQGSLGVTLVRDFSCLKK